MKWYRQRGRWSIGFGWYSGEDKTTLLSFDILCQHESVDLLTVLGIQVVKLCLEINVDLAYGK